MKTTNTSQTKLQNNKYKNLPNQLTILRLILAVIGIIFLLITRFEPFYGILYGFSINGVGTSAIPLGFLIAGIIFLFAASTDWIDGYVARTHNCVSDFGKLWDPIADKILINGYLIGLTFYSAVFAWIPIIMVSRDIIVQAYRTMYASSANKIIPANFWGKAKTVTQTLGIIIILFIFNFPIVEGTWVHYLIQCLLLIVATILSVVSGIIYIVSIRKSAKK